MSKSRKIHLKDIAKEAGVSSALVSYVLNDKHTNRINPQTAEKIKSIAEDLNYVPNFFARGLMSKKSLTIGLCIPDLAHPFFTKLARGIENELAVHGYMVLIGSADENLNKQRFLINTFIQREVDGIIVLPIQRSERDVEILEKKEIPYVFTDRYFPDLSLNYIVTDNYYGTYTLTNSLLSKGKSNICFVTLKSDMEHFKKRTQGFLDACNQSHAKSFIVRELIFDDYQTQLVTELDNLINNIDAIVFATDFLTVYGAKYIMEKGLKVPEEIEIAGFDEEEHYSIFPFPITYYSQPIDKISKKLVNFLMKSIKDERKQSIQELIKGEILITK